MRLYIQDKLNPQFVGHFKVLEKAGDVTYRVALLPTFTRIHNVFHISMLRKYISDPIQIVKYEPLQFKEKLTYDKHPIQIVDRKDQVLRR